MASLESRINRIYAALAGIREEDLTKFPPKVVDEDGTVQIWLDFRDGMTDADLENAAHILILNIAHIRDHLLNWADGDPTKQQKISASLRACQAFRIIKDLCNTDKHGYPLDNEWSGLGPQLRDIRRPMRATTGGQAGSSAGIEVNMETGEVTPFTSDGGTVSVVITGQVIDKDGNLVGDFYGMATEAVAAIEGLVVELGIRS